MLLSQFQSKFASEIKKGQFVKASWQSVKSIDGVEVKKVSEGVVRFVQYAHISGVQVVGKVNPNEQCLIPNTLYFNAKTQNYLVQLATTETKPHCKYYVNGVEVDKDTYEGIAKPKSSSHDSPVFRVKLENLISIGE